MHAGLIVAIRAADSIGCSDQVKRLLKVLEGAVLGVNDLTANLGLSHRPSFRQRYLNPALELGLIELTQPQSPRSPTQKYRMTAQGSAVLESNRNEPI